MNDTEQPKKASDLVEAIMARMASWPRRSMLEIEDLRQIQAKVTHIEGVGERRSRWNIPLRYLAEPIENAQWRAELERLSAVLGSGMLVVLLGERGTGKTHMAVELLKIVTGWNREGLYRTLMEFFMLLRRAYKYSEPGSEEDVMRRHEHPALLVLDEIGKCGQTDWEDNILFELLNRRYGAKKDTVMICNHKPDQLLEVLGPSILSRVQETGGIVLCDCPSFRNPEAHD